MSIIQPLIFILLTIFLEMMESAIYTVPKGALLEQEKLQKHKPNVFSKILFVKNHVKELTVVILTLDSVVQYLLSFYISRIISNMDISDFMMNLMTIAFSLVMIYIAILVKVFAIIHSKNTIRYMGSAFYYVFRFFKPMGAFFSHISLSFLSKKNGNKEEEIAEQRSEILATLESFEDEKEMQQEIEMAKSVLSMKEVNINQIMTHRNEFILAEFSEDIEIMKTRLLPFAFKRNIIIWSNTEDNVIGTINIQKFFVDLNLKRVEKVIYYINPPRFFVSTTDVYTVLEYFKTTSHKIVFVIDEDGSISGVVTLGDIFNEIVGETEEDSYFFKKVHDGYLVEGAYNIRILNRKLDIELPEECSTIGGLVIMKAKRIPNVNEKFTIQGIDFIIKNVSKNKIETILIKGINHIN